MKRSTTDQNTQGTLGSMDVLVKGVDLDGSPWKERTEMISLSRNGAGFYLDRSCPIGSLLSMIMKPPKRFRTYDQDLELYRINGLVQHCHYLSEKQRFQVGVALVGKSVPASYRSDPLQTYRIVGISEDGLWRIAESERRFVSRRHARFSVDLDVTLALVDADGTAAAEILSVTENVSARGASVLSELHTNVGDCLRFSSLLPEFSVLAIVRNRHPLRDAVHRIHLEFVTADFPIRALRMPHEDSGDNAQHGEAR